MSSTINGEKTKPIPAATMAAINRGVPPRTAFSTMTKPVSTVKVGG